MCAGGGGGGDCNVVFVLQPLLTSIVQIHFTKHWRFSVTGNDDTRSYRKVTKAPLPKVKQTAMGGSDIGEEELLPLGVPRNSNKRRLLQFAPRQGPRLPPEEELRRLRLRSDAGMHWSSSFSHLGYSGIRTARARKNQDLELAIQRSLAKYARFRARLKDTSWV